MADSSDDPIYRIPIPEGVVSVLMSPDGFGAVCEDFEVTLRDGRRFGGTVATPEQIVRLMAGHAETGECLSGTYFWAAGLIVARQVDIPSVVAIAQDLVRTGYYEVALEFLPDDDDEAVDGGPGSNEPGVPTE